VKEMSHAVEMLSQNFEIVLAVMTVVGGIIGKLLSDHGKKSLVKELDEAKTALTDTAKCAAPALDLAYNIGIGKIPLDETALGKLSENAAATWTSIKASSKECADVLKQLEDIRRSGK